MKLEVLLLGKTKAAYIDAGIKDFAGRLHHFVPVVLTVLKVKRMHAEPIEQIKAYESSVLNTRLDRPGYRIALDRSGRQFNSEGFATLFDELIDRGVKQVFFIIGGPVGLADEQLQQADLVLSLSQMTFPHDLSRLLLLEQLYRAFSIRAGTGYHK